MCISLLLDWADWVGFLVFNGSSLWLDRFLIGDCDLQSQLELRLSSSVELLVDRRVVRIEGDENCGTVGISLEYSFGGRRNS